MSHYSQLEQIITKARTISHLQKGQQRSLDNIRLRDLLNMNWTLERMVKKSGVTNVKMFFELGAVEVFIRVREKYTMDIDDKYGHATNAEMFEFIRDNLDFDQMIWEFGTEENPDWVHVSYVDADSNRKRCLQAYKEDGKTKYKVI